MFGTAFAANAAETCYATKTVPAGVSCRGNDSQSADFTDGCAFAPAHDVTYEVPCPETQGGWARPFASDLVQGEDIKKLSCKYADFGLPAAINGSICQSQALPIGGGYVRQDEYLSGGQNEQVRRNYYCFISRGIADRATPTENDRVTKYACGPKS